MTKFKRRLNKRSEGKAMPFRAITIWIVLLCNILPVSCKTAAKPTFEEQNGGAIAVWDLEDAMPLLEARPDLGELLSAQIVETFKENGKTVVERERLLLALEELNIGTTSLVSKATQLELGRIVGAQLMLFGGYQIIGGVMRLDLRLVEVETGRTLKAVSMTAPAEDLTAWLNTAKAAAQELL
jgi:hypothetical protein